MAEDKPAIDKQLIRELAELLAGCGIPVYISDDFLSESWHKLATNMATSPSTTVFQVPVRAVGELPWIREVAQGGGGGDDPGELLLSR